MRKVSTLSKAPKERVRTLVAAGQKVSLAARARAESLLAEIGRRKDRIAEDFYEIGLALRELSRKKLFGALGYSSFEGLLTSRNVMGATTVRRLIQLVSSMSRDEALAYGQEKAAALLDYAKATPEVDTPKTLVESGRLPGGKAIAKASVRELKTAAKQVRVEKDTGRRASPQAKAAAGEAKALHAWLRARGAGKAKVEPLRAKEGTSCASS